MGIISFLRRCSVLSILSAQLLLLFTAPKFLDPTFRLSQINDSEASSPTTAIVENLCINKETIVNESSGTVVRVAYFVRENGSKGMISLIDC